VTETLQFDVLIIGSGASGLSLALHLAQTAAHVAVLSKGPVTEGATLYAQGGVSAVFDSEDSIDSHVQDTMNAGAGLCHPDVVRYVVERGRGCVDWLGEQGVPFTRRQSTSGQGELHLTREGGHSHRRVVHAADYTGRAIEETLVSKAESNPNISLFENYLAVDLITLAKLGQARQRCIGAYVYNCQQGHVDVFTARYVVLATGGAGKVYLYTSNPDVATGDGLALAWRAGCQVANLEFMQFHPTCLYHPLAKSFLITEAVRGEGGRLLLPNGDRFMPRFDERAELAPRDIVARAIDHEMKRLGSDHVLLDITHQSADFIISHFPTVHARCLELGIDMAKQPIPVVPAAHYMCGGVVTDVQGCTSIPGLLAIGEVACTGLHGANRMASNSLLECLVMGQSAADYILAELAAAPVPPAVPAWDETLVTDSDEEVVVSHNWDELRHFMWDYVGIVRTTKRLQRALNRVKLLKTEIAEYYGNFKVTSDLLELRNLVLVAELIIRSALKRRESRGLHYIRDYPEPDNSRPPQDTLLTFDSFN
jgi:L-aspartate oxidase